MGNRRRRRRRRPNRREDRSGGASPNEELPDFDDYQSDGTGTESVEPPEGSGSSEESSDSDSGGSSSGAGGVSAGVEIPTEGDGPQSPSMGTTNEDALNLAQSDTHSVAVELGSTDPSEVQDEFKIDFDSSAFRSGNDMFDGEGSQTEYKQLMPSEARQVRRALKDKHGEDVVDKLHYFNGKWKGDQKEAYHTLETVAKKAHGSAAPVRQGGTEFDGFDDIEMEDAVNAYRDWTRISQAYLKDQMVGDDTFGASERSETEGALRLRRGTTATASASISAQMIDNPEKDSYVLRTSTLSNHTTEEATAANWSRGFHVEHDVKVENVGMAMDSVAKPASLDEGEIHVLGGDMEIPTNQLHHNGTSHGDFKETYDGTDSISAILNPDDAGYDQHKRAVSIVNQMSNKDVQVQSKEGAERLRNWAEKAKETKVISSSARKKVDSYVDNVTANVESE